MIIRTKLGWLNLLRCSFSQTKEAVEEDGLSQKIKKNGVFLGPILFHVQSPSFRTHFQLKKYLHAHAWCCLHAWLLDFRSRALLNPMQELPASLLMRRHLASEMAAFNYNQVQKFSDRKDREVYYQLKRISNVIHFALDEHFIFELEGKPLAQLICEDLGLYPSEELSENDEGNLKKIESYITLKITQLRQTPLALIRKGSFKWSF